MSRDACLLDPFSQSPEEIQENNKAMAERFTTHYWHNPLPMSERRAEFPARGYFFAVFLDGASFHDAVHEY